MFKLIQHFLSFLKGTFFDSPYDNKIPRLEVLLLLVHPQSLNFVSYLLDDPLKLGILPTMHVQFRKMNLRNQLHLLRPKLSGLILPFCILKLPAPPQRIGLVDDALIDGFLRFIGFPNEVHLLIIYF